MRGRKITALTLLACAALLLLEACGGGSTNQKVTLKITTIPGTISQMLQMNKQLFEKKYPNVTVTITEFPEDQYQNTAPQIFADKSNQPDVAWYWHQMLFNDMAKSNLFMPLNDLYKSEGWSTALGDAITKSYTSSDGNIYAVCDDIVWTPALYYNKKIFSDLGLSIPTTFSDLYALSAKLKSAGYIPIAVGATSAVPDHLFNMLLQRSVTPQQYVELCDITKKYDDINYASPEVVSTFAELQKLSKTVFQKGSTGEDSSEARSLFEQGKAAMYSDGSWAAAEITKEKPQDLQVGVFEWPQLKTDIKPAVLVFAGNALEIMASTKSSDWAKKFLAQVMSKDSQGQLAEQGILSPSRNDIPQDQLAKMGDLYVSMYGDMKSMGTVPLWFANQKAEVVNKAYEIQSSVMSGGTTPENAARQLETLFESSLGAK